MRAVLKKPNRNPSVINIDNTLKDIQCAVGGHFEALVYSYEYALLMLCDEEGKIKGLDYNFKLDPDDIVGNVLFVSAAGEEFRGLDERQIGFLLERFCG